MNENLSPEHQAPNDIALFDRSRDDVNGVCLFDIYLSCRAERMSKVDANHGTSVQVDHVVGLMPVTNAQQVVTDAQLRVSPRKVHSQTVESFGTGAHLLIGTATITTSSNTIQAHIHIV